MRQPVTALTLTISGRPVPLQRSRTRSGRHYLPPRSKAYRDLVQAEWMAAGRPSLGGAPLAISVRFYGANALADVDNLLKAILDALNGLAFADDRQVVCLAGIHKLPAPNGARTVIDMWAARRGGDQ